MALAREGARVVIADINETDAATVVQEVRESGGEAVFVPTDVSAPDQATLELGGTLVDPKEATPGEWRAKTVAGAKSVVIRQGDIVIVPRGTPHRRTVTGKGFSMILIKIYEDPLPAK